MEWILLGLQNQSRREMRSLNHSELLLRGMKPLCLYTPYILQDYSSPPRLLAERAGRECKIANWTSRLNA